MTHEYTYLCRCKEVIRRVDLALLDAVVETKLGEEVEQMAREWGVMGMSIWFKHQWQATPMPYLGRILRRFLPFVRHRREPGVGLCHELTYDKNLWSECVSAGRLLRLYEANRHRVKLEWMESGPLLWLSYDQVSETGNRFLDALLSKLTEIDAQCNPPSLRPRPLHSHPPLHHRSWTVPLFRNQSLSHRIREEDEEDQEKEEGDG